MADGSTGDAELDQLLAGIERAAEIDAESNYRVLDNHLLHTDRVIANLAALETIRDGGAAEAQAATNPT